MDTGEWSLEGWNRGGAQEVDQYELKQGCREGSGRRVHLQEWAISSERHLYS